MLPWCVCLRFRATRADLGAQHKQPTRAENNEQRLCPGACSRTSGRCANRNARNPIEQRAAITNKQGKGRRKAREGKREA
eukprot:3677409-Alexandrium_andersonii.AAC.1